MQDAALYIRHYISKFKSNLLLQYGNLFFSIYMSVLHIYMYKVLCIPVQSPCASNASFLYSQGVPSNLNYPELGSLSLTFFLFQHIVNRLGIVAGGAHLCVQLHWWLQFHGFLLDLTVRVGVSRGPDP